MAALAEARAVTLGSSADSMFSRRSGGASGLARVACSHENADRVPLAPLCAAIARITGAVVHSEPMREVFGKIARLAQHRVNVLIEGESGTGKEVVARALHELSPEKGCPFVTFNCSNLVGPLAESQLFGHVKGAFTDACEDSIGYFRSAEGGTLFLDEIGELPVELQPKLLRAVESHEIQPVGSTRTYTVNIRLVAATNRDLRGMVEAGLFRADLYYRLKAATIHLPPLRQRPEEIPLLVGHFVEQHNEQFGTNIKYISGKALATLQAHPWPGNVRELANIVQRAILLTDGDSISEIEFTGEPDAETVNHGENANAQPRPLVTEPSDNGGVDYRLEAAINAAIKSALLRALRVSRGNRAVAARLLGISRYTVYRMISRFELNEPYSPGL